MPDQHNTMRCVTIFLVLTWIVDTFDLVSDWVFYYELTVAEDGLVFGVFDANLVMATLVFCVVGSVTYVIEFILGVRECHLIKMDKEEEASEVMNIITLLIEDLPQICINVIIASCREEATNVVQIVKASAAILEILITFIVMIGKYCIQRKKREKLGKRKKVYMTLRFILMFIILVLSVLVMYLVFKFDKGTIHNDSEGLDREETDRYLHGVGVYMNINHMVHPISNLPYMAGNQWMKLLDVNSLTHLAKPSAGVLLSVAAAATPLQHIWVRKHPISRSTNTTCYTVNATGMSALAYKQCSDVFANTDDTNSIVLQFSYVPPSSVQPLGDIHYNAKIRGRHCSELHSDILTLKYFKIKPDVNDTMTLLSNGQNGGQFRYYSLPGDITDIRQAWKTGKLGCDSTGRESPKLSPSIEVPCVP